MANAAEKKAAVARKEAESTYKPILSVLIILHILILIHQNDTGIYRIVMTLLQNVLIYIAYQGILNDCEMANLTASSGKLAGGIYLDVLGLLIVVQYGGVFISKKIDWLLIIVPLMYGLYSFFGSKGDKGDHQQEMTEEDKAQMEDLRKRREKRAERRRQKKY